MSCPLSWKIIKRFSCRNMFGFSFQDVAAEFPEKDTYHLARDLYGMVNEGMLYKVARNMYHIIPIGADPITYMPDPVQVAKYMMHNKEYYIGYATALKIHGLSRLSEPREYIVTKKQIKPSMRSFAGISYRLIQHDVTRFFGFTSTWINQFEEAIVSDLEKTIVDIATKPCFCGGIIEVGNAIYQSTNRIDREKLFYYFARNRNRSAKKRFLFLTDLLGLDWTREHERMMEELGSGISLLDPSAPDQGRRRMKFGLRINVDLASIKKEILN